MTDNWIRIALCLLAILVLGRVVQRANAEGSATSVDWLVTRDGDRRGLIASTRLPATGPAWQLWANGRGRPPLQTLDRLCPVEAENGGLALNGGFWDEYHHPVGVCSGERGIHGSRPHRWGLALSEDRVWIGPLRPQIRLSSVGSPESLLSGLALNPQPLPEGSVYLIDPRSYPHPIEVATDVRVAWFECRTTESLRFNTQVGVRLERFTKTCEHRLGNKDISGSAQVLMILPEAAFRRLEPVLKVGSEYLIQLELGPLEEPVQLSTCGGPMLLEAGEVCAGLDEAGLETARAARTVAACDRAGRRLWLAAFWLDANGRWGLTLEQAAREMQKLGAYHALNLDGGRSTSVWSASATPVWGWIFPMGRAIHHGLYLPGPVDIRSPRRP